MGNSSKNQIKILDKSFTIVRLDLKGWTELNELRERMEDATSNKDTFAYSELCVQFIEVALFPLDERIEWNKVPWTEVVELFSLVAQENSPKIKFPILLESKNNKEKLPWEYRGRVWYFWLNLFARAYGWNGDIVSKLDIDTAIGLFQEIQIDNQLDREFHWGLSEISYPYNSSTKKSEYRPMERPDWMKPVVQEPKRVKIRRDMMPVGNVLNLDEEEQKRKDGIRS